MRLSDFILDIGRPVAYYPGLAHLLGSVQSALFLSQFIYWEGKQHDPERWIYKKADEFTEETGLSRNEQRTARKRLKELLILEEKLVGIPPTLQFRIDYERLNELWEKREEVIQLRQRKNRERTKAGREANQTKL